MSKEAKKNSKNQGSDSDTYYSRLIVTRHKRSQLITYVFVAFCMFAFLIFNNESQDRSWLFILTPVLGIGGVMLLIPTSEQWEYKPWQSQPRQIERHQVERK